MAKQSTAPNKAEIIRQYLSKHPTASVHQIATDLKAHNISAPLASVVKFKNSTGRPVPTNSGPNAASADSPSTVDSEAAAIGDLVRSMSNSVSLRDVRAALADRGIEVSFAKIRHVLKGMGMKRRPRR